MRGTSAPNGVLAFLGVPFAEPPVGDRRFGVPVPASWEGVRDATSFGPTAPQPAAAMGFGPDLAPGDDFLHVNVHTPSVDGALPVLVWIHGGGMVAGSNRDAWTQGDRLAARGMVVVSVQYRLGVDGFLPIDGAPHNRGVLDWRAALAWVHDNVAAFGGDPSQVTIGGQSAGSAACGILLADRTVDHLFGRVVAMSGVPWNISTVEHSTSRAEDLCARLGVDRTVDGLGAVPMDRLYEVQQELAPIAGIGTSKDALSAFHDTATLVGWLGPMIDGDVVPVHPMDALRHDVELLIGSTADEMDALMGFYGGAVTHDDALDALERIEVVDGARWLDRYESPTAALGAALTAISFRVPSLRVAEAVRQAHVYTVTWQPPGPLGAVHGIDLPYAFDHADADNVSFFCGGATPPRSLADDMSGALVRFVQTGDPGWPAYAGGRDVMGFEPPASVLRRDPDALAREVFAAIR